MNILENAIIKLRAPEPEDLEQLYQWENDSDFWDIGDANEPLSRYSIKEYIAYSNKDIYEKRQQRLMIESKADRATVGCIDLYNFEPIHQRAGIGILVDKNFQKRSFAFEALSLLKQYAHSYLHLHQLYCYVPTDNTASIRLFTKAKFEECGLLKDWIKTHDGKYKDVLMLSFVF